MKLINSIHSIHILFHPVMCGAALHKKNIQYAQLYQYKYSVSQQIMTPTNYG